MQRIDLLDNGVYLYESHHEFGDRVRPHGHAIPQILYALEGRGHIIVGGQNHHVLPDDAVFLAPYTEHAVVCDYELTLLVLAFDPTRVDMAPLTTMLSLHFSQSAYIPLSSFSAAEIRPLLRKLLFEQSKAGSLSEMAMKAYLFELLIILARATKTPHVTDSNGLRAERTRAYIGTEAAELGTDVLVLVCGPAADKDIHSARGMVMEGIAAIAPHAKACGVRLAIEPLHPMYAAERSVIVTLGEANQMVETLALDHVGVIVDVFHVWWDPFLYQEIERAKGTIFGFHVSDWLVPVPDMLMGRGMMGDGVIEISKIREAVERIGYTGPIEVEIFNHDVWNRGPMEVLGEIKDRFIGHVLGAPALGGDAS